ncbi:hypothetical protein HK407_08g13330 [Ordospora pajunii]|uniref:uncharacterized protein n=1 Tax=Ordospora pajunii TaxID=3039483 RepID=UPI0029528AEC|nr:uncharacterized protein HK407_08g13330 [Ordospora pajunii]KAH9411059.1 hypothetical protein HK407_08g13330 [Ordospora pajunii]
MNVVFIIELLVAVYCVAAQGVIVPGALPFNRALSCRCVEDDLKCKDACSKLNVAASDNPLRIVQIQKPSGIAITKTAHADEKPFVKFVEKKISKSIYGSGYTPNISNGNGSAQVIADFQTDALVRKTPGSLAYKGDIALYNGTSYRVCDLYDWATKIRANQQYMSMSDELKALYNSINENSNIEGMCAKKSALIDLPMIFQSIDSKYSGPDTSTEEQPSHSLTNRGEPVIIERNNVIPVFIRDSDVFHNIYPERYAEKDDARMLLNQDTGVSVSTITLRTTTTTTTTKAQLIEQAESTLSRRMATQTIITTRTITRQPRVSPDTGDLTTTILKTMYVDRDGMDSKMETEDGAESESNAFAANAPEKKGTNSFRSKKDKPGAQRLMELDLMQRIKSLLDSVEASNAKKSIATTTVSVRPLITEDLLNQSQEATSYTAPHTTTLTISKEHTTTVYKRISEPSTRGYLEPVSRDLMPMVYEDAFKELLKGISEFMKANKALPSTKENVLDAKSVTTKSLTTTVVETVTKTKDVLATVLSKSQSMALPSLATVVSIPYASQIREDKEHSMIMSKYDQKVDELMKRIAVNEERESKLIDMIIAMEKSKDAGNEEDAFKMMREMHGREIMHDEHEVPDGYLPRFPKHINSLNDTKKHGARVSDLYDSKADDASMHDEISGSKDVDNDNDNDNDNEYKDAENRSIESIMSVLSVEKLPAHEFDAEKLNRTKGSVHHGSAIKNRHDVKSASVDVPEMLRYKKNKNKAVRDIAESDKDRAMLESVADVLRELKETLTEHEVVTKTIISTIAKGLDSNMHLSVVSSVVEDQVRRLERELDGLEEKVEAVVGKKLQEFKILHRNADHKYKDKTVSVILPVVSRSVIGKSGTDTNEAENELKEMKTRMITVIESNESTNKDVSIITVHEETPKLAYTRIESYVRQPESMCLESMDGKSMDDVVLDIKEKKIPNNSLLISDEVVIDEIVEKLTPFVSEMQMPSISVDQTQNESESVVSSISAG